MTSGSNDQDDTGRGRLFESVLDTVGDTPTIRVNNVGVGGRTIM